MCSNLFENKKIFIAHEHDTNEEILERMSDGK